MATRGQLNNMRPEYLGIGKLFDRIRDAVIVADAETRRIILCNPAAVNVFGYSPSEALDLRVEALVPEFLKAKHRAEMARYAGLGHKNYIDSHELLELPALRKDGKEIHVELSLSPIGPVGDADDGRFILAIVRDVTERKRAEERLWYQATHDLLTNLPNRALFMDRLCHALVRDERREGTVAVLFLDLDNFKLINDRLRHEAGDRLLISVAGRIRGCLQPEDTVSRFGGDEFTILLEDLAEVGCATRVAQRITDTMQAPFMLDGREIFVTTSIGIVLSTTGYEHPNDLLCNADIALYHAKAKSKASYEVFDPTTDGRALEHLHRERKLASSIQREGASPSARSPCGSSELLIPRRCARYRG